MKKDNGCWCNFKFHLPGERKRHLKALEDARKIMGLVQEVENRGRDSNS